MRSTGKPERKSAAFPIASTLAGNVPGATSKLTNPVTRYVPLEPPLAVVIIHVPPPVTWREFLCPKVPDPLSVIARTITAFIDQQMARPRCRNLS